MTTTNLLPPIFQEQLRKQELFRLFSVLWTLAFAFLLVLTLLILGLRFFLQEERRNLGVSPTLIEHAQEEKAEREIADLNAQMDQMVSWYKKQLAVADMLDRVAAAAPSGIVLESFRYAAPAVVKEKGKSSAKQAKISLEGTAALRQNLIDFRDRLRQDPAFENFVFPPSNWAQPQNARFLFQFEIKNK